jgi:carbonic anhydrase
MKPVDFVFRFDPQNPHLKSPPGDAASARRLLEDGNRLFAQWIDRCEADDAGGPSQFVIHYNPQDLGLTPAAGEAAKQAPFAVLVGCSDARVPAEMIFGQARNNLFVVREAGNVLSEGCLGSIDFALNHLSHSIHIIVVLGHTGCGAVAAAVDTYLNPWAYLARTPSYPLRSIVDRVFVPVRKAAKALEGVLGPGAASRPGYREALLETAVFLNTAQGAYNLRREVENLDKLDVQVVYGVFDLVRHRVKLMPGPIDPAENRLADAPVTLEEFEQLARRMAEAVAPAELRK